MDLVPRPDMELSAPIEVHLFSGCCLEAERADTVAMNLDGLRVALAESNTNHLAVTIDEMRYSSRYLREVADLAQVHQDRVPVVLNFLNIVLPCLSRTLRDITSYYDNRLLTKKNRWLTMYHEMTAEADGQPLPQRFTLYNCFLVQLRDVLTRSPNFDLNALEVLRERVMRLRDARGIPPPVQVGPGIRNSPLVFEVDPRIHWAEQIFSLPLPSRTALKHQVQSVAPGPHRLWGHINIPDNSKVLFRRRYNDDRISLTAYESGPQRVPYFLMRVLNMGGGPWFSLRGAHELCIERDGAALKLMRWSHSAKTAKLWALLCFMTWEEMVLMYCTFLTLKARNDLTVGMSPHEFSLRGEKKLFQARIADDGFWHSLIVYRDSMTGGIRLHAAVWGGELRQCPVWTAFVTHQATSSTWLKRVSRRKVRLTDVQLYVFCQEYQQQRQRRGHVGAFEIYFHCEEASQRFQELFPITTNRSPPRLKTPDPQLSPR